MIIDASVNFSKGRRSCINWRRKPPFLKGRFGGNINMIGGSADSLSRKPRVRLWCGIREWQDSTASSGVLSSTHNKKAEPLSDSA